ncbi:MAG: cation-translocating P-type ATPase [Erysipelotrichaceae bacterium]|nr:cation-translocating P-type ATPase [Erysipelotrichaceae bacterium]
MKVYYNQVKEKVITELNSNEMSGLTKIQVVDAQEVFGFNELKEEKKDSVYKKFLLQFTDPLIVVLILAAIISVIADPNEWLESVLIMVVVFFNAFLGTYQENNAEKSLEALRNLSSPNAKVIRDGERMVVASRDVVVGDIIVIEAGDYIPSDARVIESFNFQVDESALTGESLPVTKNSEVIENDDLPLGDRRNMIYASTICTYGRGKAIVTAIGMENEVGKIAGMLQNNRKEVTPLQIKLGQVSKMISYMSFVICGMVFLMDYINSQNVLESFKTAVALAVAAVPEGLATVVIIVLAIGVNKMVKQHAIVRKLPAVETLGSCSVICSDKTGTLTQNRMTVVKTYGIDKGINYFDEKADEEIRAMMKYFSLCSDGVLKDTDGNIEFIGDPTETALIAASYQFGDRKEELSKTYERIDELAFDSERKMMSVIFKYEGKYLQITKGAPDVIVDRCINIKDLTSVVDANAKMADEALRVLAVAIKYYDEMPTALDSKSLEKDLTFVGMVGMIDPPRIEVKTAIAKAQMGGIKVVMITGDHLITAKAIARDLNIYKEGDLAITGNELNKMSDEELFSKIKNISVYARVAPEHKVRIVNTFKKHNMVVAMTGDGVNDSPALKAADIGCAMGITGTDVSKSASDMILTDDNFATIISAVKQGRGIYTNIRRDVQFLLSCNIGEVLTIFGASFVSLFGMSVGVPLHPIHLLFVNLVTDAFPAFAIGMEPINDEVMNHKPRAKDESFFANGLGFTVIWQGIMIGAITLGSYMIGNLQQHEIGVTMAFITLCISQLVHSFNIKTEKTIFNKDVFNNKALWFATLGGLAVVIGVSEIPFLSSIFELVPLNITDLIICLGLAFVPLPIVELVKKFRPYRY